MNAGSHAIHHHVVFLRPATRYTTSNVPVPAMSSTT